MNDRDYRRLFTPETQHQAMLRHNGMVEQGRAIHKSIDRHLNKQEAQPRPYKPKRGTTQEPIR